MHERFFDNGMQNLGEPTEASYNDAEDLRSIGIDVNVWKEKLSQKYWITLRDGHIGSLFCTSEECAAFLEGLCIGITGTSYHAYPKTVLLIPPRPEDREAIDDKPVNNPEVIPLPSDGARGSIIAAAFLPDNAHIMEIVIDLGQWVRFPRGIYDVWKRGDTPWLDATFVVKEAYDVRFFTVLCDGQLGKNLFEYMGMWVKVKKGR